MRVLVLQLVVFLGQVILDLSLVIFLVFCVGIDKGF